MFIVAGPKARTGLLKKHVSNKPSQKINTMPHFENSFVAIIMKTMLPRVPDCLFTVEDVRHITSETSLDEAQIQQWGKHFRARIAPQEREKVLRNYNPEQV